MAEMWVVVGTKTSYVPKPDGVRITKNCPQCMCAMEFFEVVPENYLTFFWVPLIPTGADDSALECPGCHNRFKMFPADKAAAVRDVPVQSATSAGPSQKSVVSCPHCGEHSRIPSTSQRIRVVCPTCKGKFLAENGAVLS